MYGFSTFAGGGGGTGAGAGFGATLAGAGAAHSHAAGIQPIGSQQTAQVTSPQQQARSIPRHRARRAQRPQQSSRHFAAQTASAIASMATTNVANTHPNRLITISSSFKTAK
jgi:hypothetical protein